MFVIPVEFHSAVAQSLFPGLLIRVLGEKHKHRNESYHKNKANKKKQQTNHIPYSKLLKCMINCNIQLQLNRGKSY